MFWRSRNDWWVLDTIETGDRVYEVHRTGSPGKLSVTPVYEADDQATWAWLGHLQRIDWPRGYLTSGGSYYDNDDSIWVAATRGNDRRRLTDGGTWDVSAGPNLRCTVVGYEAAVSEIIGAYEQRLAEEAVAMLAVKSQQDEEEV